MATTFSIPASPKRNTLEIDNFLGVDLTNTGSNIQETRSPNAPNMIRDVPGKIRKRMGYEVDHTFEDGGYVYGVHLVKSTTNTRVLEQNMCSSKHIENAKLNAGSKLYIYSANMLQTGSKVHFQAYITTSGKISISPYMTDMAPYTHEISTYNSQIDFYANYLLGEPTNAFVIENISNKEITLSLEDMMIYFVDNGSEPEFDYKYSSYTAVDEISLYDLENPVITPNISKTVTGTDMGRTTVTLETGTVKGLVRVQANVNITPFADESEFESIEIGCIVGKSGTSDRTVEPTFVNKNILSAGWLLDLVIDPSQGANPSDINSWYVKGLDIKITSNGVPFSTTLSVTNISIRPLVPKENLNVNDYVKLVHTGSNMWLGVNSNYSLVYTNMNMATSRSWQNENMLYILDGESFYEFDSINKTFKVLSESDDAYIPTFSYSKDPTGGGVPLEDLNLLSPGFIDQFLVDEDHKTAKIFQLSFAGLDSKPVKVEKLTDDGEWVELVNNKDYQVSLSTGTVTFTEAPGVTPLDGEDNIKITAYRTVSGYASRINKCTIGARFGVNGATDRLFLSGNPEFLNYDWYSGQYNFTYFPDTGYSKLGSDSSAIVGYTIINNYLAAHKDENDTQQSVIIREGDLVTEQIATMGTEKVNRSKPAFKIINSLQGPGAIARGSFQTLLTEPMFLTRSGVYAITASDVTGEKYSQLRSFYLNGALLEEKDLEDAISVIYNDMYFLFINNKVYVLDGLQATQTDRQAPYATRQYAGFYLTDVPATTAWVEDKVLWIGTSDGKICRFHTNKNAEESYSDNGKPIKAWWESTDLDGNLFYKKKTFRYIAIRLKSATRTRLAIYSQVHGVWTKIKDSKELSNIVFQFSEVDFEDFTFNTDTTDPVVSSKMRVKKVDKARFKLESPTTFINKYGEEIDNIEPFGIQNLAFEYVESGNYKG